MQKFKVSKEAFQNIFTKRTLSFGERFLQNIWFVKKEVAGGSEYFIEQKWDNTGKLLLVIGLLVITLPLFVWKGLSEVVECWGDTLPYIFGKACRTDTCHSEKKSTTMLKTLSGL